VSELEEQRERVLAACAVLCDQSRRCYQTTATPDFIGHTITFLLNRSAAIEKEIHIAEQNASRRAELIDQLAREMYEHSIFTTPFDQTKYKDEWRARAAPLIDSGWRKTESEDEA
jgi:hypothetical protein